MAIYVDNLGDSSLPVTLNNPQEGESLVWDEEAGAFINAPSATSPEAIQDTVAEMLEVDPDGSQVSLRLVSTYDDTTGKLTFNVVADGGTGSGGTGISGIEVKEDGTTRGTATVLDFIGPSISFANNTATITGLMDSIGIFDNNVAIGDVQNLNFTNLQVSISGNTLTIDGPDLSSISNTIEVQQGGVVRGDITKLNFVGATVGVADDTATITITSSGGGSGGGASAVSELTDVTLTDVEVGQVLKYNGFGWINADDDSGTTITSLEDIGDVDLSGATAGQILGWNGTQWVAVNNSGATGPQGPQGPAGEQGPEGPAGPEGIQGPAGPTGEQGVSVTLKGTKATVAELPSSGQQAGDAWIVSEEVGGVSGNLFFWNSTDLTWDNVGRIVGPQGDTGPQGPTGAQGPAGEQGPAGNSVDTAEINVDGDLIVTLTDGTIINAGSAVGPEGPAGPQGDQGPAGEQGEQGTTITSASVTDSTLTLTLSDGSTVTVSGSVAGPQGETGAQGPEGPTGATGPAGASVTAATVSVSGRLLITLSTGTVVDAGSVAGLSSATINGNGDLILTKQDGTTINAGSAVGPAGPQGIQGEQGIQGPQGDTGVGISNVVVDGLGFLQISTDDGNVFNAGSVVGPQGIQGEKGDTGEYITGATVDGSGNLQITTSDNNTINAGSVVGPQGIQGEKGDTGDAATITVGTVTTGLEGTSVIVTNSGTSSAAVLDFTIPKGDTGPAFELNGTSGSATVLGIGPTSEAGYDLEVDSANKWRTARSLSLTGKVTGLATGIDGTGNISVTTSLNGVTTDDVSEGTNQYHTTARVRQSISANTLSGITYNNTTGVFTLSSIPTGSLASSTVTINGVSISLGGSGTLTSSNITEGTNQYFTNARADARADVRIAASSINALSDVDTASTLPTNGQALVWNGTAWVPGTVSGGGGSGAIDSVNGYTGTVVLTTDDVAEDASPTNKWFTDDRARAAISVSGNLGYNSATGVISYTTPTTDGINEGNNNLYYTNTRFDQRLGQSNISQLADVATTTPTSGQVLAWNSSTSKWTPTTSSSGSGGGGASLERLAVQVDYDASGNLTGVTVLNGSGTATISAASSSTAEVEFTLTGFSAPPISAVVYGYQRVANVYTMRHVDNATWATKKFAAGGSAGSPTMWSGWDPTVHKVTLGLTKAITLASSGLGQTTHCVVQFTGIA